MVPFCILSAFTLLYTLVYVYFHVPVRKILNAWFLHGPIFTFTLIKDLKMSTTGYIPLLTVIMRSSSFLFVTGASTPPPQHTHTHSDPIFLFFIPLSSPHPLFALLLPASILYLHTSCPRYPCIPLLSSPFALCLTVSYMFVLTSHPHSFHQCTILSSLLLSL